MEKRFIGIRELSEYLGVSKHTIYYWISLKKIPNTKFGKLIRFDMRKINVWADDNEREAVN